MAQRLRFESSDDVGVFARLTNAYCLVSLGGTANFYGALEAELADHIPVIYASVAQSRVLGRMCVGNKHGLLLPSTTSDSELLHLRNSLPESVRVQRIEERLNTLGNVIVCNDHVALLHHEIDQETEHVIRDVLKVDTFRTTVGGLPLVGSYMVLTNAGALVHPRTTPAQMTELSQLLEVPVAAATVNRGSDLLGAGIVANDWSAFCGLSTTANEITVIESVLRIRRDAVEPVAPPAGLPADLERALLQDAERYG
eukprot:TRINITY_DN2901_c0_g1_i2.p1 TRINITY_DN2901_c0_g1~~TRINITY_DN2901_c0_g1_i2.p1  ORF type:complete len:255 (-),score=60.17 TRINITY_DN2901_c0_g1_i2:134-898(-)